MKTRTNHGAVVEMWRALDFSRFNAAVERLLENSRKIQAGFRTPAELTVDFGSRSILRRCEETWNRCYPDRKKWSEIGEDARAEWVRVFQVFDATAGSSDPVEKPLALGRILEILGAVNDCESGESGLVEILQQLRALPLSRWARAHCGDLESAMESLLALGLVTAAVRSQRNGAGWGVAASGGPVQRFQFGTRVFYRLTEAGLLALVSVE